MANRVTSSRDTRERISKGMIKETWRDEYGDIKERYIDPSDEPTDKELIESVLGDFASVIDEEDLKGAKIDFTRETPVDKSGKVIADGLDAYRRDNKVEALKSIITQAVEKPAVQRLLPQRWHKDENAIKSVAKMIHKNFDFEIPVIEQTIKQMYN